MMRHTAQWSSGPSQGCRGSSSQTAPGSLLASGRILPVEETQMLVENVARGEICAWALLFFRKLLCYLNCLSKVNKDEKVNQASTLQTKFGKAPVVPFSSIIFSI